MLTLILLFISSIITLLGIYIFDYQVDQLINNPLVILLSIVVGVITFFLVLALYIEVFYHVVAKKAPQTSMLKHRLAKQMMNVSLHVSNIKIDVSGRENLPKDPGFTIYSNHTSLLDIPVLMYSLYDYPVAFLAKKIVIEMISIGKWTPTLGCVMLDRTDNRKGAESIIKVIKNVKNGLTMVIFPEGTRSKEIGKLLEFKPGSFKVALKSKAPLVPITIIKKNNLFWPLRKRITIQIHKPLPFEEFKTMNTISLSDKVKDIIKEPFN